jgi:peptide/nickel transport system permease protein
MSSESSHNNGDAAPYVDFTAILGESDESRAAGSQERATLSIGVLVGVLFLYIAYRVSEVMTELWLSVDLVPVSLDWVWSLVVDLGFMVSLVAIVYTHLFRKAGGSSYFILALIGMAASVALIAVLTLDNLKLATELFGLEGDHIWPDGRPAYFLPVSVLGMTLSMVSLALVRRGDRLDRVVSVILSCIPIGLMSIPFLVGFGGPEIDRWTPMIFGLGGIAFMLSGAKLHTYLSRVTFEAFEPVCYKVYIGTLVFVGLLAWFLLDADEPLSRSADSLWILLLLVNAVMSTILLAALLHSENDINSTVALLLNAVVFGLSSSLLAMYALCIPGVFVFESNLLLHLLPIASASLLMMAVTVKGVGTQIDKLVGLVAAAVPLITLEAFLIDVRLTGADLTFTPRLFSGGFAFALYLAFAFSVFVCGLKIETFRKAQWPVVREKLRLLISRTRRVAKDVLKNPMGLIGTAILVFFTVIAVFGTSIAPYEVDATKPGLFDSYLPSSSEHWMGTDVFGHDIFSSLLYGARTSIVVGMFAALIASVVGATVGLYSGYVGGWKDEVLMRINDVMLSIPWLVLMILIAGLLGTISLTVIILIIGLTGWSATARLVRAQVLSLRERMYIERAKAIGSGDLHIIKTHILPNSFPLVFANTILTVAISILSEATLSFLHMRPYGSVTWGTMLSYAYDCSAFQLGLHYWIVMPGLCIVFLVLGFTLLGYALDEVLNPRLRKR